ncbi:hypothetical protein OH77DRAFT_447 [Trametes cingulata]|nr:hypothetical protein OH77DRAFT_447 [Trametes cingulata]
MRADGERSSHSPWDALGRLAAERRALPYRSGGAAHLRASFAGYSVCVAGAAPGPEVGVVESHTGHASPEMRPCSGRGGVQLTAGGRRHRCDPRNRHGPLRNLRSRSQTPRPRREPSDVRVQLAECACGAEQTSVWALSRSLLALNQAVPLLAPGHVRRRNNPLITRTLAHNEQAVRRIVGQWNQHPSGPSRLESKVEKHLE